MENRERLGFVPKTLGADKSYGTAPFLAWLLQEGMRPHIPVLDRSRQTNGKLMRDAFSYDAEHDRYICPEGHSLRRTTVYKRTGIKQYKASPTDCRECLIKSQCTDGKHRTVSRLVHEEVREQVQAFATTPDFAKSRCERKKVDMLFAHLKRHLGFRRLRLRGLTGASEEFLLAATAQNLRRLVKLTTA